MTVRTRALLLGLLGFLLLVGAGTGAFDAAAVAAGMAPEAVDAVSWEMMGIATLVGVALFLLAFYAVLNPPGPPSLGEYWAELLDTLAAENGQRLRPLLDGEWGFDVVRFDRRVAVRVEPASGRIRVAEATPLGQGTCFVPLGVALTEPVASWRAAAQGRGWECRAEVPVSAQEVAGDRMLGHHLDRFFARPESRVVRHDRQGLVLEAVGVRPEDGERLVREWVELVEHMLRAGR